MQNDIAKMGDNLPPNDAQVLQDTLSDKHREILDGAQRLIEAADRVPEAITDDLMAGKAADYIKMVTGSRKNLESQRIGEKEPYLNLGRAVDGFFKRPIDALDGVKNKVQKRLDTWLKHKAEEERRRRMAEAAELTRKAEEEAQAAAMLERNNLRPMADKMIEQATVTEQAATVVAESAKARPAEMAQSRGSSGAMASLRTRWVGEVVSMTELDLVTLKPFLNPEAIQKALNLFVQAGGRELRGAKIYEKSEAVVR